MASLGSFYRICVSKIIWFLSGYLGSILYPPPLKQITGHKTFGSGFFSMVGSRSGFFFQESDPDSVFSRGSDPHLDPDPQPHLGSSLTLSFLCFAYTVCPRSLAPFYTVTYCMSKKACPNLYSNLLYKMDQNFLDRQWLRRLNV